MATTRALGVIGYSFGELKGRSIFDLVAPDAVDEFRDALFDYMKQRVPIDYLPTRMIGKNGDLIYVNVSGVFMRAQGEPMYQLTVADISDWVQAEVEVKRSRDEAELYLDLISHDIANLNQIGMGYLEMALDSFPPDDVRRELLEKPLEVFQSTSRLIANVKKLRTVQHGGLRKENISLKDMITSLKADLPQAQGRNVVINYHIKQDCHVMANGLIREIFVNLIGNAMKHSPVDRPLVIDVGLDCVMSEDRRFCRITVEDNGPGISDELKLTLAQRMNGQVSANGRGRGVGLILVSLLVEDFKGHIAVEDRVPGDHTKGARFVVTLPAAEKSRETMYL